MIVEKTVKSKKILLEIFKKEYKEVIEIKVRVKPTEELVEAVAKHKLKPNSNSVLELFEKYNLPSRELLYGDTILTVNPVKDEVFEVITTTRKFILEHFDFNYKDYKVPFNIRNSLLRPFDAIEQAEIKREDFSPELMEELLTNLRDMINKIEENLAVETCDYIIVYPSKKNG